MELAVQVVETASGHVNDLAVGGSTPGRRGPSSNKLVNGLHLPGLGRGCADKMGWIQEVKPPNTDKTAGFEKLDQAAQAGEDILPPDAKDCAYLAGSSSARRRTPPDSSRTWTC